MLRNFKIGHKLNLAFGSILLITMIIALIGYISMDQMFKSVDEILYKQMPTIQNLQIINKSMTKILAAERGLINNRMMDKGIRLAQYDYIDTSFKDINDAWKIYEALPKTNPEKDMWQKFVVQWQEWKKSHQKLTDLSRQKDTLLANGINANDKRITEIDDDAFNLSLEGRQFFLASESILVKLTGETTLTTQNDVKESYSINSILKIVLLCAFVLAFILSVIIAIGFNMNIAGIIRNLLIQTNILTEAAVSGQLSVRGDPQKVNPEFRGIIEGMNNVMDAISRPLNLASEYIDRIAKGDTPPKITEEYQGDYNQIKNNLNSCIDSLSILVDEIGVAIRAARNGNLAVRTDPDRTKGVYRKMLRGINDTLDAVINPLNLAAEYIDRIARGDTPPKITEEYKGDYNEIKDNLNSCIDSISILVDEIGVAIRAARNGDLAVRTDPDRTKGVYRKLLRGVNDTLDAVINPLNLAAEYIDRIAKGDTPPKITEEYKGDYNEIKNNLNSCIDSISILVDEIGVAISGAKTGNLSARTNPDRTYGVYRKLLRGVNDTLDAVIKPLNVAAEYIDRISKGDMPPPITEDYTGDFNEIKNNINVCIDEITHLITDSTTLAQFARDKKFDIRADVSQHNGAFRTIISGVNDTLDIILGNINEMFSLLKDVDGLVEHALKGRLSARVNVDNHNGQLAKIAISLNEMLNAIMKPINEEVDCLQEMAKGNLTVRMYGDYEGDYAIIKDSLNATLDSFNELLSQVLTSAEQVISGVHQIADASQTLSQGANEQASAITEITALTTELTSQIIMNAEISVQANTLSEDALKYAENGNSQMNEMMTAMSAISDSSRNISKVIKVIDEIAFQTNLLALNASVEAARAGKHGKGFAVVAEEVRNLASRSATAAKDTTELIENSIIKSENGADIATKTATSLKDIVGIVNKVTDLISEIAAASNAQAQGMSQIHSGIEQIEKVTVENTASSEESASAADGLSTQAYSLHDMLKNFKLSSQDSFIRHSDILYLEDTFAKV